MTYEWKRAVHTLEGPPKDLAARLAEAGRSDKAAESQKVRRGLAAFALIALCVVLFFVAAGRKGKFKHRDRVYLYMSVALGVCGVAAVVAAVKASRRDVEDQKLTTAAEALRVLSVDMPGSVPARLTLDLRPYEDIDPVSPKGAARTYVQPWLTLEGELADGNKFRLGVVEKIRRKEKSKRKWTKVREASRSSVQVSLRLRPEHGTAEDAARRLEKLPLPNPLTLRALRPQGRVLTAVLGVPVVRRANSRGSGLSGPDPRLKAAPLLDGLLWAYNGLAGKA